MGLRNRYFYAICSKEAPRRHRPDLCLQHFPALLPRPASRACSTANDHSRVGRVRARVVGDSGRGTDQNQPVVDLGVWPASLHTRVTRGEGASCSRDAGSRGSSGIERAAPASEGRQRPLPPNPRFVGEAGEDGTYWARSPHTLPCLEHPPELRDGYDGQPGYASAIAPRHPPLPTQ